jgi:hypothetical protein
MLAGDAMNEDRTNSGSGSSDTPAKFVETWATPRELDELDGLSKHFVELAERLTDAPVGSEMAGAMAAGMRAFQLLRSLNLPWSDGIHAGRIPHRWDDTRGICNRYRRWSVAARRLLEVNRRVRNSGGQAVDAGPLHEAFVQAIAPSGANVDDLKAASERLEQYNRSHRLLETRAAGLLGGAKVTLSDAMNEDCTTRANPENGSSDAPATFVETWATPDELDELDALLKHFVELAERLNDAPVGSEMADAMAAGMSAFHLLRGLNLRWRDDVNAGRIPHNWDDSRCVCTRYRRWLAASRRVLEQNRRVRNSGGKAADAGPLNDAFLKAIEPANANIDDLKEAFERLEQYNKAYESTKRAPAAVGGGA